MIQKTIRQIFGTTKTAIFYTFERSLRCLHSTLMQIVQPRIEWLSSNDMQYYESFIELRDAGVSKAIGYLYGLE